MSCLLHLLCSLTCWSSDYTIVRSLCFLLPEANLTAGSTTNRRSRWVRESVCVCSSPALLHFFPLLSPLVLVSCSLYIHLPPSISPSLHFFTPPLSLLVFSCISIRHFLLPFLPIAHLCLFFFFPHQFCHHHSCATADTHIHTYRCGKLEVIKTLVSVLKPPSSPPSFCSSITLLPHHPMTHTHTHRLACCITATCCFECFCGPSDENIINQVKSSLCRHTFVECSKHKVCQRKRLCVS